MINMVINMLVNAIDILRKAQREKYAIPHFNINNLEWAKYILEECNALNSPVILGVSEGAIKHIGGYKTTYNIVSALIEDLHINIPVVLHLDHGKGYDSCVQAIDSGFSSVMIDASLLPLEENIEITNKVVIYAHQRNVSVEAEVGHVGENDADKAYAKLENCVKLVTDTKVDFLAPALGSVHGLYNGKAKINLNLAEQISNSIDIPLVLHGGTGIADDVITSCIARGICKINVNTELQVEWAASVRTFLKNDLNVYDPRKIIGSGEKAIKEVVENKVMLFQSNNRL